jgi:hypothetical protein
MEKNPKYSADPLWLKIRRYDDKIIADIFNFLPGRIGTNVLTDAWEDFIGNQFEPFDDKSPHTTVFWPWFFYNYVPEDFDFDKPGKESAATFPIAQYFLNKNRHRLTEIECKFIEISCQAIFSFHEVVEVRPGEGFTLRDILLGNEVVVVEHAASKTVTKHSILFGKIIQYEHIGLLNGMSGILIPPDKKIQIIDLRTLILSTNPSITTEEVLFEWEVVIRELYLNIYKQIITPPEIRNSDGEPLIFHELTFKITSPAEAFYKLKSLALDVSDEELLENAKFDNQNRIVKVDFKWYKIGTMDLPGGDYISLGDISIDKTNLKVTVNSLNRAQKIRKEIEKRLGTQVKYKSTNIRSMESLLEDARKSNKEQPAPEMTPEMAAIQDELLAIHWEKWIDMEIPALSGITPREAVKTSIGREKLIALLDYIEMNEQKTGDKMGQLKYIRGVRRTLGLV